MTEEEKKQLLAQVSNFVTRKVAQTLDDAKTVIAVALGQVVADVLNKATKEVKKDEELELPLEENK